MGIMCASTGWSMRISARVIKRASRSFSFRNVLRFIKAVTGRALARGKESLRRAVAPYGRIPLDNTQSARPNQAALGAQKWRRALDTRTACRTLRLCALKLSRALALDNLRARGELNLYVGGRDARVALDVVQADGRRVAVLLGDARLYGHAVVRDPDLGELVAGAAARRELEPQDVRAAALKRALALVRDVELALGLRGRHVEGEAEHAVDLRVLCALSRGAREGLSEARAVERVLAAGDRERLADGLRPIDADVGVAALGGDVGHLAVGHLPVAELRVVLLHCESRAQRA